MRIVHVIDYFQPQIGYQEFYLAKFQQKMGHKVFIVTSDRYSPYPHFKQTIGASLGNRIVGVGPSREAGLTVHRLRCLVEYGSTVVLLSGLGQTLRVLRPDIVHVHNIFNLTSFIIANNNNALDYPLIFDTHASTFNTRLTGTPLKNLKHFIYKRWMLPTIRAQADSIVPIGESEQWLVCQEFELDPKDVPIIPLGADHGLFRFDARKQNQIRQELELADGDVVIVHAGKIAPEKDLHVLLDAAVPLLQVHPEARLLIVGGGKPEYLEFLQKIARESGISSQIIFHKFAKTDRLVGLFNASDVGVWPGNPSNTVLEAMSVGLPIILPGEVSDHQSTDFLLANNNGLSFHRGDVVELRRNLELLLDNAELRNQMGSRSRELIDCELNWELITERFLEVYSEAIEKRRRRHVGSSPFSSI
ncbi:MAG: glycosyltransferase family 4 protein [Planctomycetota bacterium]